MARKASIVSTLASSLELTFAFSRGSGTRLSLACGRARACLKHHERLLSTGRNSEGPCFYTRKQGGGELLFRQGRNPSVSTSSTEAAFLRGLTPQTGKSSVPELHVSRKFRTTWPTLHGVSCSNQSLQSESRRSGAVVSFQLTFQTRKKEKPRASLVLEREREIVTCPFSLPALRSFTVWIGWWCSAGLTALKARSSASVPFLVVEERLEEVCLRGRQTPPSWSPFLGVSPALLLSQGGAVEHRLSYGSLVALLCS